MRSSDLAVACTHNVPEPKTYKLEG